jgi:pimeloyl-ACP methyl ester carboxylesterase
MINKNLLIEKTFAWDETIENPKGEELVILCHGWKSGAAKLKELALFFRRYRYAVYRLNLSTTFGAVSTIMKQSKNQLEKIDFGSEYKKVYLVGHSFGGIISKILLNTYMFPNCDRFVTIGTPWDSTPTARKIEANIKFGDDPALLGNGLKLLKIAKASKMKNTKIRVGLIGGNKPYNEKQDIGEDFDGTVPTASALALTEKVSDRKTFHLNHTELVNDTAVANSVLKFFKSGKF